MTYRSDWAIFAQLMEHNGDHLASDTWSAARDMLRAMKQDPAWARLVDTLDNEDRAKKHVENIKESVRQIVREELAAAEHAAKNPYETRAAWEASK